MNKRPDGLVKKINNNSKNKNKGNGGNNKWSWVIKLRCNISHWPSVATNTSLQGDDCYNFILSWMNLGDFCQRMASAWRKLESPMCAYLFSYCQGCTPWTVLGLDDWFIYWDVLLLDVVNCRLFGVILGPTLLTIERTTRISWVPQPLRCRESNKWSLISPIASSGTSYPTMLPIWEVCGRHLLAAQNVFSCFVGLPFYTLM